MEDAGFEKVQVGNGIQEFAVTETDDPLGASRCLAVGWKRPGHSLKRGRSLNRDLLTKALRYNEERR